jgi:PBSX family phage terminase large subunit
MPTLAEAPAHSRPYEPWGAALDLLRCRDPEVLMSGPAGTGKSRACLEKLHLCATNYPGMRGLILRKTRESLSESALVTFETKVVPHGLSLLEGPQRRMRQVYRYANGSEIIVCGLDKPQKVMSTEFDIAYIQEAIEVTDNDWEMVTTRLRNGVMPYQQLIADTNPDAPAHWLNQRCLRGQTTLIESRHEDNPVLWDRWRDTWTEPGRVYISKLDDLTGARKARLRFGKWAQAEGAVYDGWDNRVHLIDRFEIPRTWRRFRSIDFGYTNPFVNQWWAMDPDGRLYLYREIYRTQRLVKDHAGQIRELSQGEFIEESVSDHDAEDRATLDELGIPTVPAKKSISRGIQAVQARLRVQPDGKPRLFILRDSLVERDPRLEESKKPACTAEEIDGYVWPKGQDGKAIKEEPVKDNDHGMDAMRYMVAYFDVTDEEENPLDGLFLGTTAKGGWAALAR